MNFFPFFKFCLRNGCKWCISIQNKDRGAGETKTFGAGGRRGKSEAISPNPVVRHGSRVGLQRISAGLSAGKPAVELSC